MTYAMIERAEILMVRLWQQVEAQNDPDRLYRKAYEQVADLADAFAAAQEVIARLRERLEEARMAGH